MVTGRVKVDFSLDNRGAFALGRRLHAQGALQVPEISQPRGIKFYNVLIRFVTNDASRDLQGSAQQHACKSIQRVRLPMLHKQL